MDLLCVSVAVKAGNPSDEELERLSTELDDKWKSLGRRLGYDEPELNAFDNDNGVMEKAYQMLLSWKKRKGSNATYQVLYEALSHNLVGCLLLAEIYCY